MVENAEHRLLYPSNETDRAALACLLRLRSEGKSLDEIVAGLAVETGLTLAPMTLDRVLQQVPARCRVRKAATRSISAVIWAAAEIATG
jgi:hypothetical protein